MSTKYIIGGAALAGAYYIYQQNQSNAESTKLTLEREHLGERTGRKIDESVIAANDRIRDLHTKADQDLQSEKSKWTTWASNKAHEAGDSLDSASKEAQKKADALYKELHKDDPSRVTQWRDNVKGSVEDGYKSVKGSVNDASSKVTSELKNLGDDVSKRAADAKDSVKSTWYSGKDKERELAREATKSLEGWSETASQNARDYYDSLNGSVKSLQNSAQDDYQKAYDDAKKVYDDASKKFNETKSSWFKSTDDATKKLHSEAQTQLDEAKKQLDYATSRLDDWKQHIKQTLSNSVQNVNGNGNGGSGFYNWLRGGQNEPLKRDFTDKIRDEYNEVKLNTQLTEEELARRANRALRGWGESAEQFSKEEIEQAKIDSQRDYKYPIERKYEEGKLSLNREVDGWSKWFNKRYEETAEGAQAYFGDAQQSFHDAKRQLDENTNRWNSWGNKKSKEVEEEYKRQYEEAKERFEHAQNNLKKWSDEQSDKLLSNADQGISKTKKGLDKLHDESQKGLDDVQSWIKDKK
ncbi:hypothetical protein WICMUC_004202 [Wickerhamomyces mucosus]|uniref:Uncharacterized protein n=1 Tax=Wickerhamomyces mucosus TaxID=1378264 RepID=A0A9P8PJR3_9ASCO|nr:hypothetical protein WICMUC_004202 [Wickerhamomyces mucosus]